MKISPQTLGVVVGYVLLFMMLFSISYGFPAFINWELNPAEWPESSRGFAIFILSVMLLARWILNKFELDRS